MTEKYKKVAQNMHVGCETFVRCVAGVTESFKVKVGLHQGSALSPLLSSVVLDQLTGEVRNEATWSMMFAEDIVLVRKSRIKIELDLYRWRNFLERREMKVSRTTTEYLGVNE